MQVKHLAEAVPSSGIQDISSSLSGKSHLLATRNSKREGGLQLVKKESKAREVWHYPLICLDVEADAVYMPYQEHDLARSSKMHSQDIWETNNTGSKQS